MTVSVLERKRDQLINKYKLDNINAKISALPSKDLDKYEMLMDNLLGIRLSNEDNIRFEYSPLN